MAGLPMSSFKANTGSATAEDPKLGLTKQIRSHEVAIAELNALSPSRAVYQKNGNLFFHTTIQKAMTSEQKQIDLAKASLGKLNSS
ncbi:uncharacterized protein Pyn_18877 [Prunus yedoensis var. nudiflora]|uniref:Prefoldin subunit 1 n=1 Tax=Prunus yedoensis var. nudiflora TaxID=2094558 RepID=A0A314XJE3_PRUYE|nr:uncharacterized protein Pyn_18877 [Prunus yedoensis var. nudiflora]